MKKLLIIIGLMTLGFGVYGQNFEDGDYIVILKNEFKGSEVAKFHRTVPKKTYNHAVKGFAARLTKARAEALSRDPRVEVIEPDAVVTVQAQTIPPGVRRIGTLNSSIARINGIDERVNVDIAVLDTGVDFGHPDLNVFRNINFSSSTTSMDIHGHGTHVAGTAAALDNTFGVVGVAPGARIWNVKVLGDNGSGLLSQVISGLDYVAQNHLEIEVVNMSLGGQGYYESLRQAVLSVVSRGVVVVVAAGNISFEVYGNDGIFATEDDYWPASLPEVLTVSALVDTDGVRGGLGNNTTHGADDTMASFSNFSRYFLAENPVTSTGGAIDLAAPGSSIYSTYPVAKGSYFTMSGTSMAAPHVAGVVGLYVAKYGRPYTYAGVVSVRQALINMAQPQTDWGPAVTRVHLSNLPERLVQVNDSAGGPPEDGESVNVPPSVVITAPANNRTFYNIFIEFIASASDFEDGNISSNIQWYSSIDGLFGTGPSVLYPQLSSGSHVIVARATDSGGKTGQSAPLNLTLQLAPSPPPVEPPFNSAPVLTITAPTNGVEVVEGTTVVFTATATDVQDGTLTSNIQWFYNNSLVKVGGSYTNTTFGVGTHVVLARVTDSGGLVVNSSVSVVVTPANKAPVLSIQAPGSGLTFQEGFVVNFRGSAVDDNDGDISTNIVWVSSLDGEFGLGNSIGYAPSIGVHTISALIEDSASLTNMAQILLTVATTNTPPLTVMTGNVYTDKAFYRNKEKAAITITASSGGNPVANVVVLAQVISANGKITNSKNLRTGSNGQVVWRFPVNSQKDGLGVYTVNANLSRSGFESVAVTTNFTVR